MVKAMPPSGIPAWLRELYPFEPKVHNLNDGPGMSYIDHGAGESVLMLHGNPTWSFLYRNLVLDLAGRGFRCIAPDHVGCGLSAKPRDYDYSLQKHVSNVTGLVKTLDPGRFHLVVHDWGGAIGCGMAVQDPEQILSLTILNTAAFRSSRLPLRIAACRLPWLGEFMVRQFNAFAGAATFMAVRKPMPRDVKRGFLFPYDSWANRIATARFVQDIPMSPSHPSWNTLRSIEQQLPALSTKPIQMCWGMRDWCFSPEFLQRWKQIYPDAGVQEFPDDGHYLLEDAGAEAITTIRSFLEGVRASA